MIYTGYYAKIKTYLDNGLIPIAISGEAPIWYKGLHWRFLAPSYDIFYKWKSGLIDDKGYVDRFIPERLEKLDKSNLKQQLQAISNPILLCYEKDGFCHRHIVADWIKQNLNLDVKEF